MSAGDSRGFTPGPHPGLKKGKVRCVAHPPSTYLTTKRANGDQVTHCVVCGVFIGIFPGYTVASRGASKKGKTALIEDAAPESQFHFPEDS